MINMDPIAAAGEFQQQEQEEKVGEAQTPNKETTPVETPPKPTSSQMVEEVWHTENSTAPTQKSLIQMLHQTKQC